MRSGDQPHLPAVITETDSQQVLVQANVISVTSYRNGNCEGHHIDMYLTAQPNA